MRPFRIVLGIFASALLLSATLDSLPAGASYTPPAATGIGDSYFPDQGNGGYDVQHYGIDLRVDPSQTTINGTTTITAVATQTIQQFSVDLNGLTISSIVLNGNSVSWTRSGIDVSVYSQSQIYAGTSFTLVISYSGTPVSVGTTVPGWKHTIDGTVTDSEPNGASTWFASNDHPSDKARFDMTITAPSGVATIANGLPGPVSTGPDGWNTTTWHTRDPMSTYLAMVAVGDYAVNRSTTADGLPVIDALGQYASDDDEESIGLATYLKFLQHAVGPYPFEATGSVISSENLATALETQTRPVYSRQFFYGPDNPEASVVMVHELAHQWFGDTASLARWKDIWLNEGFATFLQWSWNEQNGTETLAQQFNEFACMSASDSSLWGAQVGDPGPSHLFDDFVYNRGAMTLYALRQAIGSQAFYTVLKQWARPDAVGTGIGGRSTAQFIALAEHISNRQLGDLFTTWLYTPTKPTGLSCDSTTTPAAPARTTVVPNSDGTATITWGPPSVNGGSAVTRYTVTLTQPGNDGAPIAFGLSATARQVTTTTALRPDTAYTVTVNADNANGTGPPATATFRSSDPLPTAPANVAVATGDSRATVTWTQTSSTKPSRTIQYLVRTYLGSAVMPIAENIVSKSKHSLTVVNLTNGSPYLFSVEAVNLNNEGSLSTLTSAATPG